VGFFAFTGVTGGPDAVVTSAVRTVPRLVRFGAHDTRWNFGEVECSRARFLAIGESGDGACEGTDGEMRWCGKTAKRLCAKQIRNQAPYQDYQSSHFQTSLTLLGYKTSR